MSDTLKNALEYLAGETGDFSIHEVHTARGPGGTGAAKKGPEERGLFHDRDTTSESVDAVGADIEDARPPTFYLLLTK